MLSVYRNAFLVLDSLFDIGNRICRKLIKWDNFTTAGLHKNSHRLPELQNKRGFFLYPVILESAIIVEVLFAKEKLLLSTYDTFDFVDLSFDLSYRV